MSFDQIQQNITLPASGDLSANQYQFVTVNSSGQAVVNTTAGGDCVGVLQNKPSAAGQAAIICVFGVTKVVCGTTLTAGGSVESDGSGKGKPGVLGTVSGSNVVGGALLGTCLVGATGASTQLATMMFQPRGVVATTAS